MIRGLALMCCLLGTTVFAQEFPSSYFVTDVAADDKLNIRRNPEAASEVIGEYDPYRLNVEILEVTADGAWGKVGLGEGAGWVSMSYLTATPAAQPGTIPRPMSCSGTEPFWSLTMNPRGDDYLMLGETNRALLMTHEETATNGYLATFAEGPRTHRTLIIQSLPCSDGMSDRPFGFRATLFNAISGENGVQSGCCSLDSGN